MTPSTGINRQRLGALMSFINLFAGLTGFVYQFMPDGTFLTFFVCMAAILGLVNNHQTFDERERELLYRSYGTAFVALFFVVLGAYLFILYAGILGQASSLIALVNNHWVGMMASVMCVLIGIAGMRNFREVK